MVIVIEPANAEVIHVPRHQPSVVDAGWGYAVYRPYYSPYGALYRAPAGAAFVSDIFWGIGTAASAAWRPASSIQC